MSATSMDLGYGSLEAQMGTELLQGLEVSTRGQTICLPEVATRRQVRMFWLLRPPCFRRHFLAVLVGLGLSVAIHHTVVSF